MLERRGAGGRSWVWGLRTSLELASQWGCAEGWGAATRTAKSEVAVGTQWVKPSIVLLGAQPE